MFLAIFLLAFITFGNCEKFPPNNSPPLNYRIPRNHTVVHVKSSVETVKLQSPPNFSSQITLLNKNVSLRTLPCIHFSNIAATTGANFSFVNPANNDTVFVLNGSEASTWKSLVFLTSSLNVIVPSSARIAFDVSDKCDASFSTPGINKGIIALPSDNEVTSAVNEMNITNIYNTTVKFTVKKSYGRHHLMLTNYNVYQQMHRGDIVTKNGTNFNIFYATSMARNDEFLIEYEIISPVSNGAAAFTLFWINIICIFSFVF